MHDIPKKHLNGRTFFRLPVSESLSSNDYFKCLDLLKLLFKRDDFKNSTPGFYINYIGDQSVPNGSLRLNYFTIHASETINAIENFTKKNSDKLAIFRWEPEPNEIKNMPLAGYNEGEDETALKFRNVLNASTQIALDLLESDVQGSFRSIITNSMIEYCLNKTSPSTTLDHFFSQHSGFFRRLKEGSLDQEYWDSLVANFPNGWPFHVLANMLQVPEQVQFYR